MKKRLGIFLAAVSLLLLICLTSLLGSPVRLSEISVNREQFEELMESRHMIAPVLIDEIFFNEQRLAYDSSTNTFFYSIVEGESDAYNPYIEKKTSYGQEVSVAVLDARITDEGISSSRQLRMIAYSEDVYNEYNIVCTTLPLMHLECGEEIGDEKIPVHITVFDNSRGAVNRFAESDGRISVRGRSSRTYPKKGYRISLTQESLAGNVRQNRISFLGLRQDDDWILYSAYNDQEKVRNVFSSNLWKNTCAGDNALGIDNGMEYRYLELFINNRYWGLYALGYPLDERQLGIDMTKGEQLYKKGTWDTEDRILSVSGMTVDGYETTESGGDAWERLKNYYSVLHSQWKCQEEMYAGVDIDNAIDMYLFINLIQGIDHAGAIDSHSIKNIFISFHDKDGKDMALYTPWDMDVTWGQKWTGDVETNMVEPYGIKSSRNVVMGLGNLSALISDGDDKIWIRILQKYKELRQGLWSEKSLNNMLDVLEYDIYMSGAYIRDQERWPEGSYRDADRKLEDFRSYVAERLGELDAYYARIEEAVANGNVENMYILRSLQYKDFLKSDFVLLSDPKELYQEEYREFLEYIGIDMEKLQNGFDMVVIDGEEKKFEYFDTVSVMDGIDTCIGHINIKGDAEYGQKMLCVDDIMWCELDEGTSLNVVFKNGEDFFGFDFTREYIMWSRAVEQGETQIWYNELEE